MSELTQILKAIQAGNQVASEELLPFVYEELRKLALSRMANEAPDHTLQPTALVHEAYVRLIGNGDPQVWNSKGHFFAAAGIAMRRILIENARRKKARKHGGDMRRVQLENVDLSAPEDPSFLTALDSGLKSLEKENSIAAQVVNLRFFAGLTIGQVSEALDISVRTVNRHWTFAKAWLHSEMKQGSADQLS